MEFKLSIRQEEVRKIIKLLNTKFQSFNYKILGTDEKYNRIIQIVSDIKCVEEISEFYEVLFEEFESAIIVEKASMEG